MIQQYHKRSEQKMGNASKLMYKIGRIFNLIGIILFAILTAVAVILLIVAAASGEGVGGAVGYLIWMIIYLVIYIVVYKLAGNALNSIGDGKDNKKPHIIMIVVGAISQDVFYLLGGIFGLIAESQENNNNG